MAIHTHGIIFVLPLFDNVNFTTGRPIVWAFRYAYFVVNIGLSIFLFKAAGRVSSI